MEKFISVSTGIEVLGQAILAVVNSVESGREMMLNLLRRNGIIDLFPDRWYSFDKYLTAYEEVAETMGNSIFYVMGLVTVENLFPKKIRSLHKALQTIDDAYHINHQDHGIGHYRLILFDCLERSAIMECNTPYPIEFNTGIMTALLKKFQPHSTRKCVTMVTNNQCAILSSVNYLITW